MKPLPVTGLLALVFLFYSCSPDLSVARKESAFYKPSSSETILFDSVAYLAAQPYREQLNEQMGRVLASSAQPMEKGQPESVLGNFVADICVEEINRLRSEGTALPDVDFCVLNNGGLRASLPAGDIKLKNVYELMPFDNELVIVELDGKTTIRLLEYIALKGGVPVSGLKMSISGQTYSKVMIAGKEFDESRNYSVLTSDFLAGGGDSMEMLSSPLERVNTGLKVRDAITGALEKRGKSGQPIIAVTDGRITK